MREIKYLSPTSLSLFESDRTEFYLRYCADCRVPRQPQTRPMAIGSAFDAFVKNYLTGALYGEEHPLHEMFSIENIFESQVEPQNRDWALLHGEALFNEYRKCGALADLMIELGHAIEEPRFEFTIENRVAHSKFVDGIPLLGKPDCYCRLGGEPPRSLTLDWKVNGYCSARPVSPKKGYVRIRSAGGPPAAQHRDAQLLKISGIDTNIAYGLDSVEEQWATQTCVYMWVLGEPVGTRSLVGIEQLACSGGECTAGLRVASHRMRVSEAFQLSLLDRIASCWSAIQSGHIFTDMSRADSISRSEMLDQQYLAYEGGEGGNATHEDWFRSITR